MEQDEIEESKKWLRSKLSLGHYMVWTMISKVSPSGMSRHIKSFVIIDNEPIILDYHISKILFSLKLKDDGVLISGSGMDMGFKLVYSLGCCLYPTKEDAQRLMIITGRNGSKEFETDGGYCLKQRWL